MWEKDCLRLSDACSTPLTQIEFNKHSSSTIFRKPPFIAFALHFPLGNYPESGKKLLHKVKVILTVPQLHTVPRKQVSQGKLQMPAVNYTSAEDNSFSAYPQCGHSKILLTVISSSKLFIGEKRKKK